MNKFEKVTFQQYNDAIGGDCDLTQEWEAIKLPQRATKCSAGYDFFAPFDFELAPNETITIPTGIKVLLDEDKYLMIVPRSGLGFKYRVQLDNTVGIVDSDFYSTGGHIMAKLTNDTRDNKTVYIKAGQAFAQGIINQYFITDDDDANAVRTGGFGSTDQA